MEVAELNHALAQSHGLAFGIQSIGIGGARPRETVVDCANTPNEIAPTRRTKLRQHAERLTLRAKKWYNSPAMGNYRKRVADALLANKLAGKGAVLIEGPKWCGKTTTAEQIAKSVLYMADQDSLVRNLQIADFKPSRLLEGAKPRLLDEWQIAPKLWDAVRFAVDHTSGFGHFILTGSTVPDERRDEIQHSGTGRISRMKMRPMSLWESGESSGTVSLGNLFGQGDFDGGESALTLEELAFMTCRGGWPSVVGMKGKTALDQAFDYVESVTESDISKPDGVSRDPDTAMRIMHSYARLQGTQAAYTVIRDDIANHEIDSFNEDTIASYVGALKKIFVVEDMKAWCPNLRCKTPVRTGDTRYFADPSIAAAAMGVSPADLMDDLPTFGLMFEALAVRDLRIYAELIDGKLYHYLDKSGLECDIVIHLRNGCCGLVEVKLGGDRLIEKGASSLLSVAGKIDVTRMKKPSFLMVLVADGDFAYRRKKDGVVVCPIGCLKP